MMLYYVGYFTYWLLFSRSIIVGSDLTVLPGKASVKWIAPGIRLLLINAHRPSDVHNILNL
jgi:hypothetical protein